MTGRVLGVDACRGGWVGVALGGGATAAYVARTVAGLVAAAGADGDLAVVAIDIPIGLPDTGRRAADVEARRLIGPRRHSVFLTPVRAALTMPDHASASGTNRALAGDGVSAQAFALKKRILEVDTWARSSGTDAVPRVVEVHPEVSFARLAGRPLATAKQTWAGAEQRRALLARAGIRLDGDLGAAGAAAGVDDMLDAAVAAWSAGRVAVGDATPIPDPPERFSDTLPAAIWV
ncbi:DUF429 domain-containing protein [Dactylosporangium fulvum]|uniref:DUF429 domain-containing protein n=1 Tax=Dactylosporangium fulvum TaxID=53359 RepID=A0ABY5WAH7_9ACTN|nr:DUF429 domain-containing protein [Dactylosporangium fulvum]UWP85076.1 DUF429 domain-containing protein [Dactylosporangium fulvum]